jgi:cyclohexa-1,5-dienecarbonyl-CoA hydratase
VADEQEDPHEFDVFAPARETPRKFVQSASAEGIVRINLNRPPANVLSVEVMEELNAVLEALEYQRDVKLVVLTATGQYFSAGFEIGDHLGDRGYVMLESFRRLFENLNKLDKPTLAVVRGAALGAGSMLAVGCDLVLAGSSAKFGHPEIKAGVFNTVAAVLLPRLIGRKRAFELLLTGGSLGAVEAERFGLVSRVVPDDKLDGEAAALIQRFQEGSAPILQMARRALVGALDLPFEDAMRHTEDVYLNQLMATEDAEEGLRAVLERRRPDWKGR